MSHESPFQPCRGWNGDEGCKHPGKPENDGRCDYHAIRPYCLFGWLLGGVVYPVRQALHPDDPREQRMVSIAGGCQYGTELDEWTPKFAAARQAIDDYVEQRDRERREARNG